VSMRRSKSCSKGLVCQIPRLVDFMLCLIGTDRVIVFIGLFDVLPERDGYGPPGCGRGFDSTCCACHFISASTAIRIMVPAPMVSSGARGSAWWWHNFAKEKAQESSSLRFQVDFVVKSKYVNWLQRSQVERRTGGKPSQALYEKASNIPNHPTQCNARIR